MLVNRTSSDAGRSPEILIGAHFVAPLAAKQRSKFIKLYCTARTMRSMAGNFIAIDFGAFQRAALTAWELKVLLTRAAVKYSSQNEQGGFRFDSPVPQRVTGFVLFLGADLRARHCRSKHYLTTIDGDALTLIHRRTRREESRTKPSLLDWSCLPGICR